MKTIKFLSLTAVALIGLYQPVLAGPHGGRGGSGGGGRGGGFAGGGSRAAPAFHGGGARFGGFARGGSRAAPAFSGGGFRAAPSLRSSGAYYTGRSAPRVSRGPRFYSSRGGMPSVRSHSVTASRNRSITPNPRRTSAISRQQNRGGSIAGRSATINRQANRAGSPAARSRATDPKAAVNRAIANHRVAERHDANWHRDWDKGRSHFHNDRVFVFLNGFWWGLYPWDYYPYYPYYAYGYYPYSYYGYPYDYYDYGDYSPYDYDDQSSYGDSDQYGNNATASAVQSELAKLGYYNGAIDGILGDQTEAALARYQQDKDLSVSGTVDAATLQSLAIK
jgi:Putative peptidoglycan binding domain